MRIICFTRRSTVCVYLIVGLWRYQKMPRKIHGLSTTRVYRIWAGMLSRCSNKNIPDYDNYGKRGIAVSDDWKDFSTFYRQFGKDMPSSLHSIDRLNPEGDYCLENCQWSTDKQQGKNKRKRKFIGRSMFNSSIGVVDNQLSGSGLWKKRRNRKKRGYSKSFDGIRLTVNLNIRITEEHKAELLRFKKKYEKEVGYEISLALAVRILYCYGLDTWNNELGVQSDIEP